MQRIAGIRTWTYVSHHGAWLHDADGWQGRTRAIEDKLSDALHDRLIQRFVDRRTASLIGHMHRNRELFATVGETGEVLVAGHFVGMLDGFRFAPDPAVAGGGTARDTGRSLNAAALRALAAPIRRRITQLEADDDAAFRMAADGTVLWHDNAVGRLSRGSHILSPRVEALSSELLSAEAKGRVRARLAGFVDAHVRTVLRPLYAARDTPLGGAARGLLWQLAESLGALRRREVQQQIGALTRSDRRALAQQGLRLGVESVFFANLLKPRAMALRGLLWWLNTGQQQGPPSLPLGRPSLIRPQGVPMAFLEAIGYFPLGDRAIRVDILERLLGRLRPVAAAAVPVVPERDLARLAACDVTALAPLVAALGYQTERKDGALHLVTGQRRPARQGARRPARQNADDNSSPFAALRALRQAP